MNPKDNDSKNKEKIVVKVVIVAELPKLKKAYSKLILMVRKLETIRGENLEVCEKLIYLKI